MNLTGTEKSAVMLMTLGEDQAAEVFKHLNPKEVQQLSMAVSNMRQISNNELAEVLTEFEESAIQFAALNINTNDYLRSVLVKALGEERAASLLEDIFEKQETTSGATNGCRYYSRRASTNHRHNLGSLKTQLSGRCFRTVRRASA